MNGSDKKMNPKLMDDNWLPRYWIKIFRDRLDPKITIFINRNNKGAISAMKLAAKHEKAKSIRRIEKGFIFNTYLIDFGRMFLEPFIHKKKGFWLKIKDYFWVHKS